MSGWLWLTVLTGGINIISYTFSAFTPSQLCIQPCNNTRSLDQETLSTSSPLCDETKLYNVWTGCDPGLHPTKGHITGVQYLNETRCEHWVYEEEEFHSIVPEFKLACDGEWKTWFLGILYMVGIFFGDLCTGLVSDRFGRKKALFIGLAILSLSGGLAGIAPNYPTYALCFFVASMACCCTYSVPLLMTAELVSTPRKTVASMLINLPYVAGEALMCLIAWVTRDYRQMHLWGYLPFLALLMLWFVLPESPRWLLAKGREKEVREILLKAAPDLVIPEDLELETDTTTSSHKPETHQPNPEEEGFLHILRSRILFPCLLVNYINWAVVTLCYYGLTINSVNLGGDMFVNSLLGILVEAPGYLGALLAIDRCGRRPVLLACHLISGISCISAGFISSPLAVTVLATVGKFGTSAAFAIVYLYSAEMFPTNVRNTAVATCSMAARVGGFLAPYIASLGASSSSLPLLILGVSTLLGGSTALLLPETLGEPLPQDMKSAELMVVRGRARAWGCRK